MEMKGNIYLHLGRLSQFRCPLALSFTLSSQKHEPGKILPEGGKSGDDVCFDISNILNYYAHLKIGVFYLVHSAILPTIHY